MIGSTANPTKIACRTKLAHTEDTILVIGDSLARGAGYKLQKQCGRQIVEVRSAGGARLKQIEQNISLLEKSNLRHIAIIGGTNDLQTTMTEEIEESYKKIISTAEQKGSNSITIVGIPKRYDLGRGSYYERIERKRLLVNMKLKKICAEKGITYLQYEPERSRVHGDGLHFNSWGQNELGQAIFGKIKSFLG